MYYKVGSSSVPLGLTAGGGHYLHPTLHPAAVPNLSPPPPSPSAAAAALALVSFSSPRGGDDDGDDVGGGGGVQFVHPRELQRSPGFPRVTGNWPAAGQPIGPAGHQGARGNGVTGGNSVHSISDGSEGAGKSLAVDTCRCLVWKGTVTKWILVD